MNSTKGRVLGLAGAALALSLAGCEPAGAPPHSNAAAAGGSTAATNAAASVAPAITPITTEAPAGDYSVDRSRSSLLFRFNTGYSNFTARFTNFDARLRFDPRRPQTSALTAEVQTNSLGVDNPPQGFVEELIGPTYLNVINFPQINYRSTAITLTGPNTARIDGVLTFRGQSRNVPLEVTFNHGVRGTAQFPEARLGISGRGSFRAADFGLPATLPQAAPGATSPGQVEIILESELTGPTFSAG